MNLPLYLLLGVVIYQIAYVLVLLTAIIRKKETHTGGLSQKAVSVVICAKNEQQNLQKNLPFIFAQQYPVFEVIVVDDGSDLPFSMQHDQLTVVRITKEEKIGLGKKYALRKGIEAAKNEWILLTDADCKPASDNWITAMVNGGTDRKKIVLGLSPYNTTPSLLNSLIEYETAQTALQYIGFALAGSPYMGVGRNILYEKELLLQKKWSSEELAIASGDDDLTIQTLSNGSNTTVCLQSEGYTFSDAKNNWSSWFIQKTRHYQSGGLYRFSHRMLLGSYLLTKLSVYLLSFSLCWSPQAPNALSLLLAYVLGNTFLQFLLHSMTHLNKRWFFSFINDFLFCIFTISLGLISSVKSKGQWK